MSPVIDDDDDDVGAVAANDDNDNDIDDDDIDDDTNDNASEVARTRTTVTPQVTTEAAVVDEAVVEDEAVEDEEEEELSLSQYLHSELVELQNDPSILTAKWKPFLSQTDAVCILGAPYSSARLPVLDWKGQFRKSYTLLIWIRPIVGNQEIGQTSESGESGESDVGESGESESGESNNNNNNNNNTNTNNNNSWASPAKSDPLPEKSVRKVWYRFSTNDNDDDDSEKAGGAGICVQQSKDWIMDQKTGHLTTILTAYGLPYNSANATSVLVQVPLRLEPNEWSLVGFSHNFPYLKRPQWTVSVNGTVQGRAELPYPIVDQPMINALLLQNLSHGGVIFPTKEQHTTTTTKSTTTTNNNSHDDTAKTASQLTDNNKSTRHTLHMQLASTALHSEVIAHDVQALLYTGGPTLSLQHYGKIVTPLPPIDNWTKGSSLDGPNVGIPLGVHPLALEVQHLQSSVVHYFGATHAKVLKNRIILTQPYIPGESDATPKVGLLQPSVVRRDDELPQLHLQGQVHLLHALSDFLLHCDNGNVDPNLFESSKHLSIVLLEQGLLPSLLMPFFLAQLPANGHGLDLQQPLVKQSYKYLFNLYTNAGEWAANLIQLLADVIYYGGGRVHEQVLQHGILHVLASTLRKSLVRAEQQGLLGGNTTTTAAAATTFADFTPKPEDAWFRPTHDQACPTIIPSKIVQACCNLTAVCCGLTIEIDFSTATRMQRSSDLALSAVFGLALNMDLWGKSEAALLNILSEVSWRYGNVQGGQLLRRQLPLQSLLDLLRSRLEFAAQPEIAARLSEIIQHMLLASLSHRKNISIGEHDIAACMGALSDCPLGSVGTHVILSSLCNILDWCNNSGDDDQLIQIASRMGRNLVISQYHDVVAPMLLSRTVFCGERSMSNEATVPSEKWEHHWRMALQLFAWVTSISGPEGGIAAQSTGSLLLASGLAGSLNDCLVDDTPGADNSRFINNLFMPPPSMALMIGNRGGDSWTYTDLLSDRLQVMMPLVPGFVMSLVHDGDISNKSIKVLTEMLSAVGGAFHRVFGILMENTTNTATAKKSAAVTREHAVVVKAARDYVPHLVLVAMWLEYHIRQRAPAKNDTPTVVYSAAIGRNQEVTNASEAKDGTSWVDVKATPASTAAFSDTSEDDILDAQLEQQQADDESQLVKSLRTCQKSILSTVTDLIANSMKMGTPDASTNLWRSVVATLRDSMNYTGTYAQALSRDMLCRFAAICLSKVLHRRDFEWEMWSVQLCAAVARVCDMVEEKELLMRGGENKTHSRDQVLLECAILDILSYGREMTGWCQLILPTPPEPTRPEPNPEVTVDLDNLSQPLDNLYLDSGDADPTTSTTTLNTETLDVGRNYFVPPEVPGASSKMLLPILQPCFRVTMATLGTISPTLQIIVAKSKGKKDDEEPVAMVKHLVDELKSTLIAAIVGMSFPNARDVALHGMATLRSLLDDDPEGSMSSFSQLLGGGDNNGDENAKESLADLFSAIVEEIRARYEGERRRREQALFDAYEDDDDRATEVESSQVVERMLLGGDLVPSSDKDESTGEITFDDNGEPKAEKAPAGSGSEDFVMFHDDPNKGGLESMLRDSGAKTQLGWDQYKGLGSTLEECTSIVKNSASKDDAETEQEPEEKAAILLKLLSPFLDTWDANALQDAEDSEVVGLYDDSNLIGSGDRDSDYNGSMPLPRSETAADAMTTYIEMASAEKSRLSDYVNTFLPSHRYSCQAYTERYCWSRYFETMKDGEDCGMEAMWERGIADGNRDIRSRLITMPTSSQFKRYIPKYLDHGHSNDDDDYDNEVAAAAKSDDEDVPPEELDTVGSLPRVNRASVIDREDVIRRASESVDSSIRNLVKTGNLEIVDITKKEIDEEEHPELLATKLGESGDLMDDSEDDIYGDGSLGFPSRDEDEDATKNSDTSATTESADGITTVDSQETSGITATKVAAKVQGSANHHIASSIYSHPPDNSSSILSLLHSSAPHLIEKHFETCMHVKAEGSRQCTMLLSNTHLILEYDSESVGLFEGELMAVREEAERQRLIEEAGGPSHSVDHDGLVQDKIQEQLERRQKEMAGMRPKSIRWNLSELSHVYLRRYRLRDSAIEMFFIPSGGSSFGGFGLYSPATSLFLDFGSGHDGNRRRDDAAFAVMRRSPPQTIKQWPDRSGQFMHEQLSRLTMGWVEGRITNFDYLLHLNMLAGRSYNDLCQYPVMPWVLSDYSSEEIPDLTDRSNFRDLTKPVGALNPKRLNDFVERFESFADPTIPPFMYGSHYSTSAGVVLHFLLRLHPFAGLHRQLQGGYFDVADRLFASVPRTWDMCTGYSAAEVKELTPEWYCNPAFLKNTNRFKLGTSQDGEVLDDVTLPPWAKDSPEIFVEVMRNALESDICSSMLPDWIDLIFGRKQQGPEAIKANNVFFYLTYYGSVDVAAIEDEGLREATELQIAHFGQCPMQLFVRPHVRRVQKILNFRKLTFYQMLSAYTQGAESREESEKNLEYNNDGSQRLFGEPLFLPFFSAPISHWIHLDAPPPGPHADLIAVRLAGVDRCLAIDSNGIFHSFRWAWKPSDDDDDHGGAIENKAIDKGNFIAQRELPRFKTVPRLLHAPSSRDDSIPAVVISKTLFASRSVLLVLSDGDGCGGLAMQLVDPSKASVKGEAMVPSVHSSKITCMAMDPIGTAAGHGGVGGELAIVGSADGGSSLWRFMSSHYLPLRPRIRMRGHAGRKVSAVALSSAIHVCASISQDRCCIFSIGNGAMIRSWAPPDNTLPMISSNAKSKTVFCDTPALGLSVQGFVVTVCKTTMYSDDNMAARSVITLHLFSLEGISLGSKALESWRGVPHKITCTPDGTAITVCSGRGVTIHRLSAITPLEFIDEWHITEADELDESTPAAWDVDFGPSLMRPIVAAAGCSSGVLRLHALPGISPWSERHKKSSIGIGKAFSKTGGRIKNAMGKTFGFGKTAVGTGKEISKEVTSEVKERGVGGFLSGTLFRKGNNSNK